MAFVLGLHGAAGAGKDTFADYLLAKHGWTKKLSFAENLKEMCKAIFFLSDQDVYDQEGKKRVFSQPLEFTGRNLGSIMHWMSRTHRAYPVTFAARDAARELIGTKLETPRRVLQFVGTEICRSLVPTYHVDIVTQQVEKAPQGLFAVTDVRFPNEADLIVDSLGGKVVRLEREAGHVVGNIDRTHASETALADWGRFDAVIDNNRDGLKYLFSAVDDYLEQIKPWLETAQSDDGGVESSSPTAADEIPRSIGTSPTTP